MQPSLLSTQPSSLRRLSQQTDGTTDASQGTGVLGHAGNGERRPDPARVVTSPRQTAAAAIFQAAGESRAPRTSLCKRVTLVLAGVGMMAGFTGLQSLRQSGEHGDAPLGPLPPQPLPPRPAPLDTMRDTKTTSGASLATASCKAVTHGRPGPDDIEEALAGSCPKGQLKAIASSSAHCEDTHLPLEALSDMVAAFRASRSWSDFTGMRRFVEAMMEANGGRKINDAHLERLMRVWGVGYGDFDRRKDGTRRVEPNLSYLLVDVVTAQLGGAAITEGQLGILIRALTQEPSDMRQGDIHDKSLHNHAYVAAKNLCRLMVASNPDRTTGEDESSKRLDQNHLKHSLRIFLKQTAQDARWKPVVLFYLNKLAVHMITNDPLYTQAQWKDVLLEVCRERVAALYPGLRRPDTVEDAIFALEAPAEFNSQRSCGSL